MVASCDNHGVESFFVLIALSGFNLLAVAIAVVTARQLKIYFKLEDLLLATRSLSLDIHYKPNHSSN